MIGLILVSPQWVSPSTLRCGSGTTEWLGRGAALWWTPGGKQVTVVSLKYTEIWNRKETKEKLINYHI